VYSKFFKRDEHVKVFRYFNGKLTWNMGRQFEAVDFLTIQYMWNT